MVKSLPNPFYFEDALLKIGAGADTFEGHCSKIELVPGSNVEWAGLTPTARFAKAGDWSMNIDLAQDYETAGSFSNYLFDHEGEVVPFEFSPIDGGQKFYGTLTVSAAGIGGGQGAVATSSVSLKVSGKPSKTAPTP